jgi:hypothetical protein
MKRSSGIANRRNSMASLASEASASGAPACMEVSFCAAPWELWRKISLRPDAPSGALKLVENTPFRVHRKWREPRQSSLRDLGAATGGAEHAVTLLEWMASSGQVRWDSEQYAVELTHLVWLRENGLAAADCDRHTFVLGDVGDPMACPDDAEVFHSDRAAQH